MAKLRIYERLGRLWQRKGELQTSVGDTAPVATVRELGGGLVEVRIGLPGYLLVTDEACLLSLGVERAHELQSRKSRPKA